MVKVLADINPDRVSSITVKPSKDFQSYESGRTIVTAVINSKTGDFLRYEVRIELNINGTLLVYIEEFFYADQFTNAVKPLVNFEGRICYGDVEFEAKAFCAQWLNGLSETDRESQDKKIKDNYQYYKDILNYINYYDSEKPDDTILESFRCIAIDDLSAHFGYLGFVMKEDGKYLDEVLTTYYKYFAKPNN